MVALLSSRWWRPIGLQAAPLTKAWGGLLDPGYFGPPAHTGRKPKCEKNGFLRLFVRPICPARADGGHLGLQDSSAGQISSALLKWKPQKCSFCAGQLRDHVQGQTVKCGMQGSSALRLWSRPILVREGLAGATCSAGLAPQTVRFACRSAAMVP